MKIAHISDLHLDFYHKKQNNTNTLHLLEYIAESNYDHLIISGDITENSDRNSFLLARKLLSKFGLLNSSKLTLTIGNHDIYGGVHLAEDVINFPSRCKNTNYNDKVSEFAGYFSEAFPKHTKEQLSVFPFIKELDDAVLISLNSIAQYSYVKNPFASNGKIDLAQLESVLELLKDVPENKKRIVITHHHFSRESTDISPEAGSVWQAIEKQTMKLRGKKKVLKSLMSMGVELILHGHLHENSAYSRSDIAINNAGGSILSRTKGKMFVNTIDTSNSGELLQSFSMLDKPVLTDDIENFTPIQSYITNRVPQKPEAICLN
ncbi:MAG: metallophosphoesterase [Ignavibacteria bacterium]|nr:metallophosphoesterase [Ignavibacteria bacterium]